MTSKQIIEHHEELKNIMVEQIKEAIRNKGGDIINLGDDEFTDGSNNTIVAVDLEDVHFIDMDDEVVTYPLNVLEIGEGAYLLGLIEELDE